MATNTEAPHLQPEGETKVVCEGRAEAYLPAHVFYNPVQEFNRDLTIAIITQHVNHHYRNLRDKRAQGVQAKQDEMEIDASTKESDNEAEAVDGDRLRGEPHATGSEAETIIPGQPGEVREDGVRILEGLAASGLRSVRFAREIPGLKEVVCNDLDKRAVKYIEKNIEHNNLDGLVKASLADVSMLMYQSRRIRDRFDVIDLDPYGSPAPFLDAAVQAVKDGGILCVTSTDLAVLCGNSPETCHSKYGAMSLKGKFCHEMALRIVLQSIESHANRYSRYIEPLLCLSIDFYIRLFIRVHTSQRRVKHSVTKLGMVYVCVGCGTYTTQPLATKSEARGEENYKFHPATAPSILQKCPHCGFRHHLGGPIWTAPLHNYDFLKELIDGVQEDTSRFQTSDRILGMLSVVQEELPDVPLYYVIDELCRILHCTPPTLLQFRSAIMNAGHQVSLSHAARNSLKTTAPMQLIWDILRCWVKTNPVKESRLKENTPAFFLLQQPAKSEADFTLHPDANPPSRKDGLLRWQANPERDWGPKPRAAVRGDTLEGRRQKGIHKAQERKRKQELDLKQFPCKRLRRGLCQLGDQCRYSHAEAPGSGTGIDGAEMDGKPSD